MMSFALAVVLVAEFWAAALAPWNVELASTGVLLFIPEISNMVIAFTTEALEETDTVVTEDPIFTA
jgi:hypothetical protein